MIGILFLVCFFIGAWFITMSMFAEKAIYIKVFITGALGLVGAMCLNMPFSFMLGFNIWSNILGLLLLNAIAVYLWVKKGRPSLKTDLKAENKKDLTIVAVTVLPIVFIICILFNSHVIVDAKGTGDLYGGQSTFGDLAMHLGMITSMAEQGKFPPDYSILPGVRMSYPFLVNSLSAAMVQMGTPLRESVLFPSYIFALMIVLGLYSLAKEVTGKNSVAVLSTILYFFNGGFGFVYFFDKIKQNPQSLTKIFTESYNTPTNLNGNIIRWSNTICDMIIPQRTAMAGWAIVLLAILLLYYAIKSNQKENFILVGVVAGLMPMIHTHSFFAFGLICAIWIFVYMHEAEDKHKCLVNWLVFGGVVLLLALPQLFIWTFQQTSSQGFIKFHNIFAGKNDNFLWSNNKDDNLIWFWIKNVGLIFILIIPAFLASKPSMKRFYSGGLLVFFIAGIIQLQPNEYDNNKLFYIWYMLTVILVSEYMVNIYDALKKVGGRKFIAFITIFVCVVSGTLTIGREYVSGGQMHLFSKNKVEAAEFLKKHTPKDAMFFTGQQHLNFVSTLAGRNIVCGTSIYVFFHGLKYQDRVDDIKTAYTDISKLDGIAKKYSVDYLVLSDYELNGFKVNPQMYQNYKKVYSKDDISIFAISERANKFE